MFKRKEVYAYMDTTLTIVTGTSKIRMPSKKEQRRRIAEYRKNHIMWFDKDYFGQKEIFLVTGMIYGGESEKLTVLEKHWADYLSNNATDIESLRVLKVSNKTLASLANQKQLARLELDGVNSNTDLSFLRELPNLKELRISSLRRNVDLGVLTELRTVTKLALDFTHPDVDWESISKLEWLDSLELGDSNIGSTTNFRIPNFDFLAGLKNLRDLRLSHIRPLNKDYSPLVKLTKLLELTYPWERGQKPSVEQLAKHSVGLAKVARRKAEWEAQIAQPGYFDLKPIKKN